MKTVIVVLGLAALAAGAASWRAYLDYRYHVRRIDRRTETARQETARHHLILDAFARQRRAE
jgi:hypothetical protein